MTLFGVRVGEDIAALAPHSPERARLAHSVLHRTDSLMMQRTDGRSAEQVREAASTTVQTAPNRTAALLSDATTTCANNAQHGSASDPTAGRSRQCQNRHSNLAASDTTARVARAASSGACGGTAR